MEMQNTVTFQGNGETSEPDYLSSLKIYLGSINSLKIYRTDCMSQEKDLTKAQECDRHSLIFVDSKTDKIVGRIDLAGYAADQNGNYVNLAVHTYTATNNEFVLTGGDERL